MIPYRGGEELLCFRAKHHQEWHIIRLVLPECLNQLNANKIRMSKKCEMFFLNLLIKLSNYFILAVSVKVVRL